MIVVVDVGRTAVLDNKWKLVFPHIRMFSPRCCETPRHVSRVTPPRMHSPVCSAGLLLPPCFSPFKT
eukprot:scaffold1690_cov177-Ochromonas_danica.AAC.33